MKLLTKNQSRQLDKLSIVRDKIASLKLMEKAGKAVFKVLRSRLTNPQKMKAYVFCGPGNNGGDGFVVARYLMKAGVKVFVFVVAPVDQMKGDSLRVYQKLLKLKPCLAEFGSLRKIKQAYQEIGEADMIVDALFGTGLNRKLSGLYAQTLKWLNGLGGTKVSVDIPSGLCADTGKVLGVCFKSDMTVTFGFAKQGFYLGQAHEFVGDIHIADIGFSKAAADEIDANVHLITKQDLKPVLDSERPKTAHKGTFGRVYTIGCSKKYVGAGVMTAMAALRMGAGYSTLVLPQGLLPKIDRQSLELTYEPVGPKGSEFFTEKCTDQVLKIIKNSKVMALGPGIGNAKQTIRFVKRMVSDYQGMLILDADGLNAIAQHRAVLKARKAPTLLTPHPGEMGRLLKKTTQWVNQHRLEAAQQLATRYQVHVLLKGYRSILCLSNGKAWINPTGNSAMGSAGQGDVLTGIYAGLLAEFGDQEACYLMGCYLHGYLGDYLKFKGQRVVLASDIINCLSKAFTLIKRS